MQTMGGVVCRSSVGELWGSVGGGDDDDMGCADVRCECG